MNAPIRRALLALALLAPALPVLPASLVAQDGAHTLPRSRFSGTLALLNTQPVGTLRSGPGIGIAGSAAYALDPARVFRIRGEMRGAIYDHENREVCLSSTVGCRIVLDLNTSYTTFFLGIGPEVVLPIGPVELALDGTVGWGAYTTSSSLSGVDENDEDFGDTTNYDDNVLAWSTGGELRIPIRPTFGIAVGAHYQHNGEMSYLTEGGITDNPDGSITMDPITSDANFVAITLGISFTPRVGADR